MIKRERAVYWNGDFYQSVELHEGQATPHEQCMAAAVNCAALSGTGMSWREARGTVTLCCIVRHDEALSVEIELP